MSTLPDGSVEVSPSVEPLNYSPDDAAKRLGVSRCQRRSKTSPKGGVKPDHLM